ncbi:MAG: hypothetical protein ABI112_07335 [Terracoccus sp.]
MGQASHRRDGVDDAGQGVLSSAGIKIPSTGWISSWLPGTTTEQHHEQPS